jgi:SCY1-like protein 2
VDKSLGCLPTILAVLDFSTIKNEVFPLVAAVFSKTSSLGIKIRGLEAFVILCGGSIGGNAELSDGLDGSNNTSKVSKASSSTILDKYTVQEKVVPLMRAMKTKEPGVVMAALAVFRQVGRIADTDFLAMDVLPILWSFSLGPLLNLDQFQEFMNLIKSLSSRIEQEQTRKLRDLSSSNTNGHSNTSRSHDLMNVGSTNALLVGTNGVDDVGQSDFERLVRGKGAANGTSHDISADSLRPAPQRAQSSQAQAPVFSWSTPVISPTSNSTNYNGGGSRAITPDHSLNSFATLNPISIGASKTTQSMSNGFSALTAMQPMTPITPWPSAISTNNAAPMASYFQPPQLRSNFTMASPPPTTNTFSNFSIAPPPSQVQHANTPSPYSGTLGASINSVASQSSTASTQQPQKRGLDAYESLL